MLRFAARKTAAGRVRVPVTNAWGAEGAIAIEMESAGFTGLVHLIIDYFNL